MCKQILFYIYINVQLQNHTLEWLVSRMVGCMRDALALFNIFQNGNTGLYWKWSFLRLFHLSEIVIFPMSLSYLFGCTHSIWKFLGQGLNPSCSFDLRHSIGNAGPFNLLYCARNWTCASAGTRAADSDS